MKNALSTAVSAIVTFLLSCRAFAAAKDMEAAAEAPAEMVDAIYVVLFGVLFVGMIVAFFVYFWWVERKRKQNGGE